MTKKNGLSQKAIKEGIERVLDNVEVIADEMWKEHFPHLKNENLRQVFIGGFFLEVMNEFKKRYER